MISYDLGPIWACNFYQLPQVPPKWPGAASGVDLGWSAAPPYHTFPLPDAPLCWNMDLHRKPIVMTQFCRSIFQHHGASGYESKEGYEHTCLKPQKIIAWKRAGFSCQCNTWPCNLPLLAPVKSGCINVASEYRSRGVLTLSGPILTPPVLACCQG